MINKIWITGASSGIGEALAKKFAREGWQVAASARRENLLQSLNKHNSNIYPFPLDVTDSNKTIQVFENIIKKLENIDICVFCTGIHDPQSEKKLNVESIRRIMEVNFFGTLIIFPPTRKLFFKSVTKKYPDKRKKFIEGEYEDIDEN